MFNTQAALAKVLKPYMLTELPERSEQVLYCEMSAEERQFYVAIRERSLLRLRQAASHSGLVDSKRVSEPSAKVEQLLQHMQERFLEK
jgi:SNF2 family DNA or RNA helicase